MRKLKLSIEELEVASFDTESLDGERGTIAGHDVSGLSCPCQTWLTRVTCCTPIVGE